MIELTTISGATILVNTDMIMTVLRRDNKPVEVVLMSGLTYMVNEEYEVVKEMIDEIWGS